MKIIGNQIGTNIDSSLYWQKNDSAFTGDDIIDAYLDGKEVGRSETFKILLSQFNGNIEKAKGIAQRLYTQSEYKQFKIKAIHLKAEDITKYRLIFIVDKKDFINDSFREIYIIARSLKNETEAENFYLSFSFLPYSANLSEDCLLADGYFMKYEKK